MNVFKIKKKIRQAQKEQTPVRPGSKDGHPSVRDELEQG